MRAICVLQGAQQAGDGAGAHARAAGASGGS